jgi:curved DNA-binding protein CbpA
VNLPKCYHILGLRPGATAEQVHRVYKRLALKHHPDRTPGDAGSHRLFCEVTEAYASLKETLRRQARHQDVEVCPRCGTVAELFAPLARRRWCADCLLATRRRLLPKPTFRKVRCFSAIGLQAVSLYCVLLAGFQGDWRPGAAAGLFVLAAMAALSFNFLTTDVIT